MHLSKICGIHVPPVSVQHIFQIQEEICNWGAFLKTVSVIGVFRTIAKRSHKLRGFYVCRTGKGGNTIIVIQRTIIQCLRMGCFGPIKQGMGLPLMHIADHGSGILCPLGVVGNIGVINQTGNNINEHEIVKAIGVPENIFVGHNGSVNIACASGLGMPTEYISRLGKSAVEEQKERLNKRSTVTLFLDELDMTVEPVEEKKQITGKRKRVSFDELRNL